MQTRRGWHITPWVLVSLMVFAASAECASAPVMVEHNVFAQDRKPPTDEPTSAAPRKNAPGLSPKAVQLDGVFIRGDRKEALIRLKGGVPGKAKGKDQSPYVTVREGERIAEYQVTKIEPRSVSLEKDGEAFVVNLFAEGKVVPPAPPVPTAPGVAPEKPDTGEAPPPGHGPAKMPRPVPQPGQGRGEQPGSHDAGSLQQPSERAQTFGGEAGMSDEDELSEEDEPIEDEDAPE